MTKLNVKLTCKHCDAKLARVLLTSNHWVHYAPFRDHVEQVPCTKDDPAIEPLFVGAADREEYERQQTLKSLAIEFERLLNNYKRGWLVKDTEAFKEFCFAHSDAIAAALKKASRC